MRARACHTLKIPYTQKVSSEMKLWYICFTRRYLLWYMFVQTARLGAFFVFSFVGNNFASVFNFGMTTPPSDVTIVLKRSSLTELFLLLLFNLRFFRYIFLAKSVGIRIRMIRMEPRREPRMEIRQIEHLCFFVGTVMGWPLGPRRKPRREFWH